MPDEPNNQVPIYPQPHDRPSNDLPSEPPVPVSSTSNQAPPPAPPPAPIGNNIPHHPLETTQPHIVVGGMDTPVSATPLAQVSPVPPKPKRNIRIPKRLVIVLASLILLVGVVAAVYFGYYMSPGLIWSESLENTGKGYDSLTSYVSSLDKTHYSGFNVNGQFNISGNGSSYSATLSSKGDGEDSNTDLKLNIGITNLNIQVRTVKSASSKVADMYLNVSGLNNSEINSLLGSSAAAVDQLNGQWIQISSSLIQSYENSIYSSIPNSGKTGSKGLSTSQINTTLNDLATVNNQYVFTTNKNYSITYVQKDLGFQTIDGIKTYHYRIGFNKDNIKSYLTDLKNTLDQSPFGTWYDDYTGQTIGSAMNYTALENSANKINSSDTMDVWMNASSRVIYKVRIPNKANSAEDYVDVGLGKITNSTYPIFINSASDGGTSGSPLNFNSVLSINTKSQLLSYNFSVKSDGVTIAGNLSYQPSNSKVNVTAPSSSVTLQQALNDLGLSNDFNSYLQGLSSPSQQSSPSSTPPAAFSGLVQSI